MTFFLQTCGRVTNPNRRGALVRIGAIALTLSLAAGFSACTDLPASSTPAALRPLQPLVYTEQPTLSPQAAGVRERRMLRHYEQGASVGGSWGQAPEAPDVSRPSIQDPETLGRAIFTALVERDEAGWDALFVAPEDYAGLVRVDLENARKFVDTLQASSLPVWRSFAPGLTSETLDGGLGAVLEFVDLELGEGRRVDGPIAQEGDTVVQHWGNILKLRLRDHELVFELKISKILRIQSPMATPGAATLSLGSPIVMSPLLESYASAGLHLKPELLETREYPYPLAVGNFWRYQRSRLTRAQGAGSPGESPDSGGAPGGEQPGGSSVFAALDATESLLEVVTVDRYGSRRLVTLRRSYNDEALSTSYQHLLLLPRRIYACSAACRRHIKDLRWLLGYLDRETPIFVFPLGLQQAWGAGGDLLSDEDSARSRAVFEVAADWRDVSTPAGTYTNTVEIRGLGPYGDMDRSYRGLEQTRYFAHGHGLVQRVLREKGAPEAATIVEKLVESRIMPR